eukprot:gene9940-10095_t
MGTAFDVGQAKLRDLQDVCDLCGTDCDGSVEKCLEKFLKKHGYASDRKTGFPCPMGRGKGTRIAEECKGKVEKSHPIVPRNEEKKKKAVAPPLAEVLAKQPKHEPDKKQLPTARKMNPPKIHVINAHLQAHKNARSPGGARPNAWQDDSGHHIIRAAPITAAQPSPEPLISPEDKQQEAKAANVPVGWSLHDALPKAQKKNLQRRKKKQQMMDAASEATDGSADHAGLDEMIIEQYYRLLALQGTPLSDDEEEDAIMDQEEEDQEPAAAAFVAPAVSTPPLQMPVAALPADTAPSSPAAPPTGIPAEEDKALQAAIAASEKDFELEQERQRQREILARAPPGMYNYVVKEAGYSPESPMALADGAVPAMQKPQIPAAAVTVPVATPVLVAPANLPAPHVVPELLHVLPAHAGKQSVVQQFLERVGFGTQDAAMAPDGVAGRLAFVPGTGHISQQQRQLPEFTGWQQQQRAIYTTPDMETAKFATTCGQEFGAHGADGSIGGPPAAPLSYGGGYAPIMAAGRQVASTAADEDDDLTSLLQLCGVAG